MKKIYTLIVLFSLLFCYTGNVWGETLTVADGTNTNAYVPVYGNYVDYYQQQQIVYAPEDITAMSTMSGSNITGIKFYQNNSNAWSGTFYIRMTEISAKGFSSKAYFTITSDPVFEGTITGGSEVNITLNTPYLYSGGNLLVDIQTKNTSSGYKSTNFYGNTNIASITPTAYAYTSGSRPTAPSSTIWFLPKTTFTYEAAGSATCPSPTGLTKSSVTASSATFTWTAGGEETSWQYCCLPAATSVDWTDGTKVKTATSATATITGLEEKTDYKFYVRAYCAEDDQSGEVTKAFTTPCSSVTQLASYGFEDVTTGSSYNIPDCWKRIAYTSSGTPYPCVVYGSDAAHNGNKYLYFYGGGSTSSSIIVLQPIENPNTKAISFWYYTSTSTLYGQLQLGYMTDPEDASTFNVLTNGTLARVGSYTHIEDFLLSEVPSSAYIAFCYSGGSSNYGAAYLDDIEVYTPSSCAKPTDLTATATSATSINLSWAKGGDETKWNAQYRVGSGAWTAANNISTTVDGTNCTATLTGLSDNTTYEIQVQADCGGEQSGWSNSAEVTTPCAASSALTWTGGNFESPTYSYGNYALPGCMDKLSGTGYPNYPYIYSSYYHAGSQCLYFYGGTSTSVEIAIFPPFTQDLNTLLVSLYYQNGTTYGDYTGNSYGSLQVGYITDPTDFYTFTAVETLPKLRNYGSTATEVAISGASTGARLAIRYSGGSSAGYLCVDDISISLAPTCFKPSKPTLSAQTYNTATFNWSASGKGETRYQYACVPAASSPSSWTLLDDGVRSKTVEGLTPGTSYKFYVRSYCSADDQSESIASDAFTLTCNVPTAVTVSTITNESASVDWTANNGESLWNLQYRKGSGAWATVNGVTKPYSLTGLDANSNYEVQVMCAEGCNSGYSTAASFKTMCDALTIDASTSYYNDFEGETASQIPDCWTEQTSTDYPQVLSGSASYGGSGKCIYFYGTDTEIAILPAFSLPISELTITLKQKVYSSSSYGTLHIGYITTAGTYVNMKDLSQTANEYADVEWTFDDAPATAAYIALKYVGGSSSWGYLYVDNLEVKKTPTCFKPASIADASSITSSGATLSWTASGHGETSYQWAVAEGSAAPVWVDDEAHKVNNTTSKVLTGLEANTAYTFYVRSYCGADDQSEAVSKAFTTACGTESVPFNEDFTGVLDIPACWTKHAGSYYNIYVDGGELHFNSGKTAQLQTIVLPKVDAALAGLAISFKYRGSEGSNYGKVQVGYLTDKSDNSSFVAVGSALTVKTAAQNATVFFTGVSADAYIAIRYTGGTSEGNLYLDDIRVARTVTMADDADNSDLISTLADEGELVDVLLSRSLQMNGDYNPLCLPFSLSAAQLADEDCPLNNFKLKVFDYTQEVGDELHLFIAGASSIEAGAPYFASYQGSPETAKSQHLFRDVKITATTAGAKTYEKVTYQGAFETTTLDDQSSNSDKPEILFLGANNTIYYPNTNVNLKGFRAYFTIDYSVGAPARSIRRICFGEQTENTATGIEDNNNAQTTRKSVENNQVIIIRDGVKYTVLGQKIQ